MQRHYGVHFLFWVQKCICNEKGAVHCLWWLNSRKALHRPHSVAAVGRIAQKTSKHWPTPTLWAGFTGGAGEIVQNESGVCSSEMEISIMFLVQGCANINAVLHFMCLDCSKIRFCESLSSTAAAHSMAAAIVTRHEAQRPHVTVCHFLSDALLTLLMYLWKLK